MHAIISVLCNIKYPQVSKYICISVVFNMVKTKDCSETAIYILFYLYNNLCKLSIIKLNSSGCQKQTSKIL